MKTNKIMQVGAGYWNIVSGNFAGMWLSRKAVGTDVDGETIYSDVKLSAGHPLDNPEAARAFPTLVAAVSQI